jgi:hypothetical protein
MSHVVLLGDSIFDNAAYVGPRGTPVIAWLRQELPAGWRGTLLAIDGSTTHDVPQQLRDLPATGSHLVVSIGGNNALFNKSILSESARSATEVVRRLADIQAEFSEDYSAMLEIVLAADRPTVLCTIYEPRYGDPGEQRLVLTALSVFNDVIIRQAIEHGLPLLDLRKTCRHHSDFANPIEPSSSGGARIARAIAALLGRHSFEVPNTVIYW